jgi:exonuclease III
MIEAGLPLWKRIRLRTKDINMVMQFAIWNVRTLLQAGNMNVIVQEAESYKMDVVALQEIRVKGRDSIRKSKFTLHYSGNDVRQGNRGIGCIVSKKVSRSIP